MYVAWVHKCGTRVCVALACVRVCVQDITHTHVNMKCQEKNGTFHVYHPHIAPMYSNVSNVLVYDPFITVCVCLYCMFFYSYVTRIPMYSYVTPMYSHFTRMYSCVTRFHSYFTRMYLYASRMLLVCHSYVLVLCFSHNWLVYTTLSKTELACAPCTKNLTSERASK